MAKRSPQTDALNLDGLPLELPDVDTLTDAETEGLRAREAGTAFGKDAWALTHREKASKITTFDWRKVKAAADALERMPAPGEYIHAIVGQEFAGFDLLPAFLQLTGAKKFSRLYLTTLGFSRDNLAKLGQMFDARQIDPERLTILCAEYFRRVDSELWDIGALMAKEHGFGFRSFRNHTKLILAELAGRAYCVESSANLRSCTNIEQFTICQSRPLFDFHAAWIKKVFAASAP
jgi:hypothetical protein